MRRPSFLTTPAEPQRIDHPRGRRLRGRGLKEKEQKLIYDWADDTEERDRAYPRRVEASVATHCDGSLVALEK
eukprot:2132936-Heterocapsa_arctica.AAC.1